MFNSRFITAIDYIDIEGDVTSYKFNNQISLSCDKGLKNQFLDQLAREGMGGLEVYFLMQKKWFFYSEIHNDYEKYSAKSLTIDFAFQTDIIIFLSWLVRDNSFNKEMCYLRYAVKAKNNYLEQKIDSNFISNRYRFSDNVEKTCTFTVDEVGEWIGFVGKCLKEKFTHSNSPTLVTTNFNRIQFAMGNIQLARTSCDVCHKIMYFCMALESLFSTSTAELTHIVSERVALYFSAADERKRIYLIVKKCYGVRSKIAHGTGVKPKDMDECVKLSNELEIVMRYILKSLMYDNQYIGVMNDNEKLNEYFINRLLN